MIKRSIVTGFLVGILFTLVALYPMWAIYAGPRVPGLPAAGGVQPLLLIANGAVGVVVLGLVGSLAARRANAPDLLSGAKAGAISGFLVALVFYVLLLAPTSALVASARLWAYEPTLRAPYPPDAAILRFFHDMTRASHSRLDLTLLAGAVLGAIEGAIVGWRRRHNSRPVPSLLDVVAEPQARRRWFAGQDEVWRAGMIAGLVGGGVMWLGITVLFFINITVEWPTLESAIQDSGDLLTRAFSSDALLGFLAPLFLLAVVGIGALAVLLLRDPPRRHLSRFLSVIIAGVVASVFDLLALLQLAYSGLGIMRYPIWVVVQYARSPAPPPDFVMNAERIAFLQGLVDAPMVTAPFFYVVPVLVFALILLVMLLWLAPQAALYGLTLPLLFRRPVDRAARIARAVNADPNSLLPRIYQLYTNDAQAVKVLPHLAFLLRDEVAAQVVAAYHGLSSRPGETERAAAVIRDSLAGQEGWRWRAEVGELYRVLEEGLAAKGLARVHAIEAPPRDVTSSLPPALARACEGIGRVLEELKKVERVDDLSTKIIFLNSAQAALLELHRHTEHHSQENGASKTPYPEIPILHTLFDLWQEFILTASRDLQGRADLHASLLAHEAAFAPRLRQCIVVTNQGLNVAQNVHLSVAGGDGYELLEGAEQQMDILAPGETREFEFWLAPDAPRRVRLAWQLRYDDAIDCGRQVDFADAMALQAGHGEGTFQRIFPIPYVTGTPLRSGEMFVGRQDIFSFVREHLLGTYQNNVIVLHGQRRTGKTSILYRLQEMLAETHVAVLVDMQGKAARGTADFLYALSDDIAYTLEGCNLVLDLPDRADYEAAPEFTFRNRFLRAAVAALDGDGERAGSDRGRNLLLMFDEFEELQKRVEDGRLEPEIFSFLRNLMQHEPRLDFLFSGTHKLEELGAEYWSILFNIAAYKRITFLDPGEVRRLVTEPVASHGLEYDPLAVERIVQVTAGHPYFTQVVCHELIAFHNEVERSYLTVTCVDQVLERIVERGEAHFKYIWAGATPDEQRVMLALTDLLPDADAAANPAQIVEELDRKAFAPSHENLVRALAHLEARDILARSGPQSSLYRFKIDLIRRWIGTTRPAL